MMVGFLGVVLPILPGIPLSWLGLLIYAWGTGFERISITLVVVFFILTVLTLVIDFVAPILGAKKYGASKFGIFGAFLGFIVGIFVLGPLGIILGPFIGALLGELIAKGKPKEAVGSAFGTVLGLVAGILFKIIVILIMAGFFIASWF